jgi:hypothetical protein
MKHLPKWSSELAAFWRNYVPPNRPSRFDLNICMRSSAELLGSTVLGRPLRLMILGSTTEFRDWAFEARAESVVVDNSKEYFEAVSAERTHINPAESVELVDWREMTFDHEFDMVVGDLIAGQIPLDELPGMVERIKRALLPHGCFITKSYFRTEGFGRMSIRELFKPLANFFGDPFPIVAYDLSSMAVDSKGNLYFPDMLEIIDGAFRQGHISERHRRRFDDFGWDSAMKVHFTMPTFTQWIEICSWSFGRVESLTDWEAPYGERIPTFVFSS